MIKNTLLAAAAVAALATGTVAVPSNADAGINVTISGSGSGYGYGYGSRWKGYGYGYGQRDHWRRSPWYRTDHRYRPYRRHCRWKVKKIRVRYWDAYNNCWVTRKVPRRYRSCY